MANYQVVVLVGKRQLVPAAHDWIDPTRYTASDGSCALCGQRKVTHAHNCDARREIATRAALAAQAERDICTHPRSAEVWRTADCWIDDDVTADCCNGNETPFCGTCGARL